MQYSKEDPRANQYIQYYFQAHESQDAYPHIAIVDPRTGEQVKVWSGPPVPKPMDFVMQLHEFLDRYSLNADARNPVAMRKAESKKELDINRLSEEEMLEMAMKNSMANGGKAGPRDVDPDELTRLGKSQSVREKGKASMTNASRGERGRTANNASRSINATSSSSNTIPSTSVAISPTPSDSDQEMNPTENTTSSSKSPFAQISSAIPHQEPPSPYDPKTMTRIQFRYSGGRQIRIFLLSDPIRRLYEWLKASNLLSDETKGLKSGSAGADGEAGPGPGKSKGPTEFELIFLGRNLIEALDVSIEEAGLKNGTVMVEVLDDS